MRVAGQRTVWELDQRASELERERNEAREAAYASRQAHAEMEEAYRHETAARKRSRRLALRLGLVAVALLVLLVGSILLWSFVLR